MNDTRGQLALGVIVFILSSLSFHKQILLNKIITTQMTSHAGVGRIVIGKQNC